MNSQPLRSVPATCTGCGETTTWSGPRDLSEWDWLRGNVQCGDCGATLAFPPGLRLVRSEAA